MRSLPENRKQSSLKIKFTVIIGYLLVVAVMALGLVSLYNNLVKYSNTRIKGEEMPELLIVGNTLSMLYEIESGQNLMNAENAEQYFQKYDSITPKIRTNLDELKQVAADSSRIEKLDTIQLLVDRKRENLQEIAVLLDSFRRAPRIVMQYESSYVPLKLNQEITDYLESKNLNSADANKSDTSVVAGNRRGFMDRVRDVFVARVDSTVVIEKRSIVSDHELKLIVDTIVNKVRYSERLDLERQRQFQLAYLARQELMSQTNQMLTSRIDELLKGIEQEELERSLQLLKAKEQTIAGSQRTMFIAFCLALLIAFVFAILFLVDINKSQRYRRQLEASNKRISDLLASREKLMLTISHDIKAPMSSILGFIELMDMRGDRKNEAYLNNMKNSGEQILELASALLDYHKLEEGSWQLKESNFSLYGLIENTASGFGPLASRKGLEYRVENNLPEQLVVYGDLYMIRQIMNNIISNAVKYTSEGSVRVRAWLKDDDSLKRLLFSVTDTGEGIDDADQQIIFQEFKQLDNPLGEEGSGLGLAITKGFIEALNGTIRLNSRKGEGAEFIVEIPLKDAKGEIQVESGGKPEIRQQDLEGVSVLLVDDDPVQLAMTSEMLAKKNIKSVTQINPDKVLPLLQSSSFDILFMDIQMPGTDGLTLVEKIRRLGSEQVKNMPVIGLSARSDISKEKMQSAGFTDFLFKPFTSDRLYSIIRHYVGNGNPEEEDFMPEENQSFDEEKGARALIEFVSEDKQASAAILQLFINETGECRVQLEEAFLKKEKKAAQGIIHKILPLFRLMGNKPLIDLMVKLEKGEILSENEESFVLNKIEEHLEEATTLRKEIDEK
ncbi:ATP-binding protein [Proteiniphilum sp. X52]|uniref:hybrid sensor histidine kinase/response regulator n=1 Tax=Proteiniphilum sp. X52 TaxID=2382159 RepID=UPI000F0A4628|nr:ATP-binding protein [Proteiniphilum sp. X52]RNC64685.1 response regulator [Proteiniphilum sp. X52]